MLESEHHKRHDLRIFKSDSELCAGDKTTGRILDEFCVEIKMFFFFLKDKCMLKNKLNLSSFVQNITEFGL